MKLYCIKCHDW